MTKVEFIPMTSVIKTQVSYNFFDLWQHRNILVQQSLTNYIIYETGSTKIERETKK